MKNMLVFSLIVLLFSEGYAQTAKILRDSGVQKLAVFLGTWKSQSPDKPLQYAVYSCKWSVNGNYLVCDQLVTDGTAKSNNLAIYSYNHQLDSYELSLVGIPGVAPFAIPVTYKGDELIYSGSYMQDGKKVFTRTLNIFVSAQSYIYKVQTSIDSSNWLTSVEGKAIRIRE